MTFTGDTLTSLDFALTSSGEIIAASGTSSALFFKRWNGNWADFPTSDKTIASSLPVQHLQIIVDSADRPQVTYLATDSSSAYVIRFVQWQDGWQGLDSSNEQGISASPTQPKARPRTVLDAGGAPVIIWLQNSDGDYKVELRKWTGSAWGVLGNGRISDTAAAAAFVGIDGAGTHFVAQFKDSVAQLRQWDGANWIAAMADAAVDPTTDRSIGFAVSGNRMVLAMARNNEIVARRWIDGASTEASVITGTEGTVSDVPAIAIDAAGVPYVAWHEQIASGDGIYVRRYNGSAWEDVGDDSSVGRGIAEGSSGAIGIPRIKISGRRLCVGWTGAVQALTLRCAVL